MAAAAGKRAFVGGGPRIGESGKFEGNFEIVGDGKASYIQHRLDVWNKLKAKHDEKLKAETRKPIKIELPDGKVKDGQAFETTPLDIALGISKGLADAIVAAKVVYKEPVASLNQCVNADADSDDEGGCVETEEKVVLWDLTRPLEGSCSIELLKFDSAQGQDVFWHSSAHILGQALEREFGCHLTIGPALESGFYYDGFFGNRTLTEKDFAGVEKQVQKVVAEKQPFERCAISKADALELFKENPFKVQLITNKVPEGAMTSCYRCGPLIDLCRGPHLPNTSRVKEFAVMKNSSAYWLGDQKLDSLQRLYGISFPSKDMMKDWKKFQEEAAKRDHRNVGKQQELFMFHATYAPGSCFWFPMGARIYNKLVDLMRNEYRLRGFSEVITPNMYDASLFKVSGHYQNYKDDMYSLDIEKQEWMLKPMNCPGHFVMFDARARSYKELPLRFADFGVLHRNELSGALSGLTRVRRFQQDDAHLFVRPDQIKDEVRRALEFLAYIYSIFGFDAHFALSTRPKKALGSKEIWDNAESQLKSALNEFGRPWSLNPGDGAFYGPKIDVRLTDATRRQHQCGTIQLDFNNPIRFNLQYRKEGTDEAEDQTAEEKVPFVGAEEKDEKGEVIWREGKLKNGFERPVVIHRAIVGSVERFAAILTENYAGKWPFWLSPRQVMVVPVNENCNGYAEWVARQLTLHKFHAEADVTGKTLKKKVRESQLAQWNYIAVVGEKEKADFSVNLRQRDIETPIGVFSMLDLFAKFNKEFMPASQTDDFEAFEGRIPTPPAAVSAPVAPQNSASAGNSNQSKRSSVQLRKQCSDLSDGDVEHFLENHPYVKGFAPTQADVELYAQFCNSNFPETPNLKRWFDHMRSFSKAERSSWPSA